MIFCSRNEDGTLAWVLVQEGRKTVTRRLKLVETGKVLAVQPGRGKRAVCHVRVLSCVSHVAWVDAALNGDDGDYDELQREAVREGFRGWNGLLHWFDTRKPHISIYSTFRIEFELIKEV